MVKYCALYTRIVEWCIRGVIFIRVPTGFWRVLSEDISCFSGLALLLQGLKSERYPCAIFYLLICSTDIENNFHKYVLRIFHWVYYTFLVLPQHLWLYRQTDRQAARQTDTDKQRGRGKREREEVSIDIVNSQDYDGETTWIRTSIGPTLKGTLSLTSDRRHWYTSLQEGWVDQGAYGAHSSLPFLIILQKTEE